MPRSDAYYSERVCEAADALTGAKYKALARRAEEASDGLLATLSDKQKKLCEELDDCASERDAFVGDAIYRAGFLEGYAAGRALSEKYRGTVHCDG
jgi:hypothetical protein